MQRLTANSDVRKHSTLAPRSAETRRLRGRQRNPCGVRGSRAGRGARRAGRHHGVALRVRGASDPRGPRLPRRLGGRPAGRLSAQRAAAVGHRLLAEVRGQHGGRSTSPRPARVTAAFDRCPAASQRPYVAPGSGGDAVAGPGSGPLYCPQSTDGEPAQSRAGWSPPRKGLQSLFRAGRSTSVQRHPRPRSALGPVTMRVSQSGTQLAVAASTRS